MWGAFALPWQHRAEVARATGLPMLAVIGATLIGGAAGFGQSAAVQWTLYFLYIVALAWLAISVHRMVLLDGAKSLASPGSAALRRLARFVGAMIALWLFYAALNLAMMSITMLPFSHYVPAGTTPPTDHLSTAFPYINRVVNVLALWPVVRFSLLFPALAVDHGFVPRASWQATRGNGWRLVIVIGVLPWALNRLVVAMHRDDSGWVEFGVMLVIGTLLAIIQVVALSLSYWELTQPEPPPTPPPA